MPVIQYRYWVCLAVAAFALGYMVGQGMREPFKWQESKTRISWSPDWQKVYTGESLAKMDTCTMIQNDCWQTVLRGLQEQARSHAK